MATHTDAQRLAQQLLAGATPEQSRALLDALLHGPVAKMPEPTLRPVPTQTGGFRVRLALDGAEPPVWRRLELPGDVMLPRLHHVIQAAMGWTDSHLHRFRAGSDPGSPCFVTRFDLDEGDDGMPEDGVRLDQIVAAEGDALLYEYDFGDGWDHVLEVEEVLEDPPAAARCVDGAMACPPEDCGGIGGYQALAGWVRMEYDDTLLPDVFEDAAQARAWLPLGWHPDHFDLHETDVAEPVAVTGELRELLEQQGGGALREVLARSLSHAPAVVTDAEAERLTETYRVFLDVIGDGVTLTGAGYLPPAVVERVAEPSGITGWWFGKANREEYTPPVAGLRESARALGLVAVRKGRLTPTVAGTRCRNDSRALWQHVVGRLPLGTKDFDRDAGWLALAVAGSGVPAEDLHDEVSDLLTALGWRTGDDTYERPPARSPTLRVLEELAGAARIGWRLKGTDLAVAATARAVVQRR